MLGSDGKQKQWGHVVKCVECQTEEFRYVASEEQREGLVEMRMKMVNPSSLYTSSLLDFVTTTTYYFISKKLR